MKRLLVLMLSLFMVTLVSCVEEDEEPPTITEVSVTEPTTKEDEDDEDDGEIDYDADEFDSVIAQECRRSFKNSDLFSVMLRAESDKNIRQHSKIEDMTDTQGAFVVGMIGQMFDIKYDDSLKNPEIVFEYDYDILGNIPEESLAIVHINAETGIIESKLDKEEHTISAKMREDGIYVLVDAYEWLSFMGYDTSRYEYEGAEFADTDFNIATKKNTTVWEKDCETGDIMELANKKWAKQNAPDFHVSTPEQLASVVWYVNSFESEPITITIEEDIDISNYEWKSMGWYNQDSNNYYFNGWIYGQNHTINGLTIYEGYESTGFVGYGLGVSMYDLTFTNAYVKSTGCVGIAGGEIYHEGVFENVHTSGEVSSGGDDDYACIIGREGDMKFKNCSSDALVNGEPFEYFSYRDKRIADVGVIEDFHITLDEDEMIVSRDDPDGSYQNLCWNVYFGEEQLEYSFAGRTLDVYNYLFREGSYEIYLTAYINGTYVKVSNVIEYESEGYEFRWSEDE